MPTTADVPAPLADPDRLAALAATGLFERGTDPAFDRLARVARRAFGASFAFVSLVGARRQVVKGRDGTEFDEGLVVDAICQRTVADAAPLAIPDTAADPLCDGLPVVRHGVRAYLGVPLRGEGGAVVGTVAVCDAAPRAWTDDDVALLQDVAATAEAEIAARAATRGRDVRHQEARDHSEALFRALFDTVSQLTGLLAPDGTVVEANRTALRFAGLRREDVVGRPLWETLSVSEAVERRHRDAVARAADGETVRYEETVRDARGAERVLDVTLKPALGEAGLLLLEGRDVTGVVQVRRLQIAMMAGLAGTWDLDLHTGAVRTGGGTDLLFGLDPDAAPHGLDAYLERVHPDDVGGVRAGLDAAAERGGGYDEECRIVHEGGEVRWVRARGTVTADDDGRPERIVGAVADVTEHRREAEAAERAATDLQTALDAAQMGRWEIDLGTGEIFRDDRAREIHGVPATPPRLLFEDAVEAQVHPSDRARVEAVYAETLATGEPFEVEYRTAAAPPRWVRATGRVLGETDRVAGVAEDVTAEREAEAALRASEARFRRLADAAPALLWVTDPDGACTFLSRSWYEYTGQAEAGALGFGWLEAVHPDDADRARDLFLAANEAGAPFRLDYRLRRYDGVYRWAIDAARPRHDADGRFAGFVGSVLDVDDRVAAEAALRESEERYRTLFESVDVGFCLIDVVYDRAGAAVDYRFVEANPAFVAQTGLEDAVGRTARELVPGLERHWVETYAGVAASGEPLRFTNGSEAMGRWFEVYATRVGGAGSRRVAVLFTDVTERRQAEAALAESEARYRTLFESVSAGFIVVDMVRDRAGAAVDYRYVETNPAFYAQTGIEPDVKGRLVSEVIPDLERDWVELFGRVAATGEPARRLDHVAALGQWYDVYVARVGGAGSDRVGVLFTDVTEQREAERSVRESEARFRGTFENAAVGIAHVGVDGAWLDVNERLCEIVGYAHDELLGLTFQDITHPDDLGLDLEQFGRLLAGEVDHYQLEKRYVHRDGHTVWINLTVAPNWASDGEVDYVISVVEDVSEKKAAEAALRWLNDELEDRVAARTAELERSNAELDQFAYVASHDLKAPIRAIDSLATWIDEDAGDGLPDESARHLALLRQRAKRMERLLDSLLAYSRAGRREAAPEPVDTAALAREVAETVAPPEGFDVRVEGDFPTVEAARAPLALVFRNLVGNAIKHHDRPDGRVTVSARVLDSLGHPAPAGAPGGGAQTAGAGWAEFTVEDDGPGVAPEYAERVFGMFQTLRPRDEVEGSGMGLAIVKKTVESRGGAVSVEEGDAGGARFRFTWPLTARPAPAS